jgi:hypothetical protein
MSPTWAWNRAPRYAKGANGGGPHLLPLANALSALYPKDSEEKSLPEAMLLAVSR